MKMSKTPTEHFEIAVIGGGAAGMMAALHASSDGARVVIIEKNITLGKKLLLTGNGRCNITRTGHDTKEFIKKIGRNGRFLFSSLSAFGPEETMGFFENLGLRLKTEKNGRVFPESDKSQDVVDILTKALDKNGIEVLLGQNVLGINMKDDKVEYLTLPDRKIYADNFILTTGGKSYPATGSTGDGYRWIARVGHKVNPPSPALVPVKITEPWIKDLQGISLKNIKISLTQDDHKINLGSGEIIFTHFGLSGPAAINASKTIGRCLEKGEVFLELDLLPALDSAKLEEKLKIELGHYQRKSLKNYLATIFPEKLADKIMALGRMDIEKKVNTVTKIERTELARLIKNIKVTVDGLLDFNQAVVTSGGADLKEIDPKTMRSKIINNLFLAGEVLDLDGPTGGYNLQIAWTTGRAAGESAKLSKKGSRSNLEKSLTNTKK